MLLSDPFAFTFRGQPATLTVVRNDGFCWGIIQQGDTQLDVNTRKDWYDHDDDDVAEAFMRAARNAKCVTPAVRRI